VTDVLPLELIAPPVTAAVLPVKELVVRVSGPLSTRIPPPLALVAELFEKLELLMLYVPSPPLKLKRSAPPPPLAPEVAVLPENVEPVIVRVPLEGVLISGSPAE